RDGLISARYLLRIKHRHCDLIVLDEGTSALDPITESKVFESLNRCRNGKTMILVTHRIGMFAQQADRIICMDGGQVIQNGNHDELM
ncbi:P-loop containing nucleoside triphosphate hydrolase protein, partial [Coprinellus micaceus]